MPTVHAADLPQYDRTRLRPGILHIGVGAFHRAHQAVYTDDVLNETGGDWGIIGASLRSATAEAQLAPQDGLYTVTTLSPTHTERRVIGAIGRILTATTADGYRQLIQTMADPAIHVITVTVTEKAYCHLSSELDTRHPDVLHDLNAEALRHSLPGVLSAGLRARFEARGAPVTILSCDNLAANGVVLSNVVSGFAALTDPDLLDWMTSSVSFPSTMVDRIVPATTPADRDGLASALGVRDEGMVCCEPFKQWVIEDRFAGPRPPWEAAGALLVADVGPYESAKLRLLNGPHSACAYLGMLHRHEYVHQVMDDHILGDFVRQLVTEEVIPTVTPPAGLDLQAYARSVFQRFANSEIAYATVQVATDGSQKLAQRLVPVARERLQAGQSIGRLALVFAAWVEHLNAPAPDPLSDELSGLYQVHRDPDDLVAAIFADTSVWRGLGDQGDAFKAGVAGALKAIRTNGLVAAIARSDSA